MSFYIEAMVNLYLQDKIIFQAKLVNRFFYGEVLQKGLTSTITTEIMQWGSHFSLIMCFPHQQLFSREFFDIFYFRGGKITLYNFPQECFPKNMIS